MTSYHSDSEGSMDEKKISIKEMIKIISSVMDKEEYKYTDSVEYALEMYGIYPLKGEWRKELIDFFFDLRNNPINLCCERHLIDFPSNPYDVNALKGSKKTTVQHEVEKMYECSCNRRHLAREIVRALNP